ncbi:hypothetical protein BDN70DRAFT_923746 [Pholiota conissans]|uniref:Uncharacterized protein n=1 Tax=Pholiota conissans TaxID=109636 RepID=A0A9P5YXL9_9AGAR|nr:hypothetical protein BDN70DRAFT_923746 [Pholiota conissans]
MSHVPFPSTDDDVEVVVQESSSRSRSSDAAMNRSAASSANTQSQATTSSSKLTSSDKLSALPTSPVPTPNASRIVRSTNFVMGNIKRGYRHSLDSPSSLPLVAAGDFDIQNHGARTTSREINLNRYNEVHPASIQRSYAAADRDSAGKETPQQRVSFDSERSSLPTMRSVGQAFSRIATRGSDPQTYSPPQTHSTPPHLDSESDHHRLNSRSPSQSKSRAASPLRMLHNWSSNFHRGRTTSEERFVPINPYKLKGQFPYCSSSQRRQPDIEAGDIFSSAAAYDCDDLIPVNSIQDFFQDVQIFVTDTFPREIYLNFLLRLPAMYFSRVARIYEDADVSRPDIQRMIDNSGGIGSRGVSAPALQPPSGATHASPPLATVGGMLAPGIASGIGLSAQVSVAPAATMIHMPLPFPDEWTPPMVSPALIRFKHSWEAFIDSLLREWKTLNVVSALLASAILTVFQIPEAADDPLTRTFALLSLICALMSLSYGCIYIVRFGTMRSMFHASRWAEEARKTNTSIWWNVWVLLATPAVWMAWSMLLFLSAILSFVWRTGSINDSANRAPLDSQAVLGPRIGITTVLLLGIIYLGMIVSTFKKYGSHKGSSQALAHSHPTTIGARPNGGRTRTGAGSPTFKTKGRRRGEDVEMEMERRGRERERSASVHVRRREEEPDSRGRRRRESKETGVDSKKAALKDVMGLRHTSRAGSQRDVIVKDGLELELESKGEAEVEVSEIQYSK